jgi:uncharacterized protein YneF (UPF0154 family)
LPPEPAATVATAAPSRVVETPGVAQQEPEGTGDETPAAPASASAPEKQLEESSPANGKTNGSSNSVSGKGISDEQVSEIRRAIQTQQKFLSELLEHGHRWEIDGSELRIFFATDKRPFAEMVEGRDSLEKIRAAASKVLNRPVRVCAKIEAVAATATPASRVSDSLELRAKFERDPMVRSMLQRFGGKISEVKRREEGL